MLTPEKSPTEVESPSEPRKRRQDRTPADRFPHPVDDLQANHCRNVNCENFGVPAKPGEVPQGKPKGQGDTTVYPPPGEASCQTDGCKWFGKSVEGHPQAYAELKAGKKPWSTPWICRGCRKIVRTGTDVPPPQPQGKQHHDIYGVNHGALICHKCGEMANLRSNIALAEEIERMSGYLEPRVGQSCTNAKCANHRHPVASEPKLYWLHGKTESGQRYRCKACQTTFTIAKPQARQRRPEVNIWLMKLLHSSVSMSKIARLLEISPSTLYDKIDYLHEQCTKFQGDRERELIGRNFAEIGLATDRQAYLCNWNLANDARNLQITGVATADIASGYVLAMNVAYDPAPDPAVIEAEAIAAGDYDVYDPYRRHARVWLEGDYAMTGERAANLRLKRKEASARKKAAEKAAGSATEEAADEEGVGEASEEEIAWTRRLPERGMLVHQDYTLTAHFYLLSKLLSGADRLCFYSEKESGIRSAIMSAFRTQALEERMDLFLLRVAKGLTVKKKQSLVGQSRREFHEWLAIKRAEGVITTESHEQCRNMRLLEAIEGAEVSFDRRSRRHEAWIHHPFPNMAEPERFVLHANCLPINAGPVKAGLAAPRPRTPIDEKRLTRYVDRASLHAVDRYFMQIRREISELERGIAVASNAHRVWYGYTPYDPAMIPKLLDIHRAYYNWIQVSDKDNLTRAQRFGLARGKIRHQDVIYYR